MPTSYLEAPLDRMNAPSTRARCEDFGEPGERERNVGASVNALRDIVQTDQATGEEPSPSHPSRQLNQHKTRKTTEKH